MFYQYNHSTTAEYFCKEYGENFCYPLHLHNSFELICVYSGEMDVTVDDAVYTLKSGDSVLVFPNQLHALNSTDSKHMLCIFSADLVKAFHVKTDNKIPQNNRFTLDKYLLDLIDKMPNDATVMEKKGILYLSCAEFDKGAEYKNKNKSSDLLLYNVFEFVDRNSCGKCSLEQLSKETGYSYSYLSRYFKKSTGLTFNNYVNQHRIYNACYLLNNTDFSILQCALDCGYDSLRSFNRNFINYRGITPSDYRNKKTVSHNNGK